MLHKHFPGYFLKQQRWSRRCSILFSIALKHLIWFCGGECLVCTTHWGANDKEESLAAGLVNYVPKPLLSVSSSQTSRPCFRLEGGKHPQGCTVFWLPASPSPPLTSASLQPAPSCPHLPCLSPSLFFFPAIPLSQPNLTHQWWW